MPENSVNLLNLSENQQPSVIEEKSAFEDNSQSQIYVPPVLP